MRRICPTSWLSNLPLFCEIAHPLVASFRPEARRRDISVARLILDMLDVIAADGLVGAVLDDGYPSPPPRPRAY